MREAYSLVWSVLVLLFRSRVQLLPRHGVVQTFGSGSISICYGRRADVSDIA